MKTFQHIIMTACLAMPALAFAQQSNTPQPPELEVLEEGPAAITADPKQQQQEGDAIKERVHPDGSREIEVKSGPSTYYMKPQTNRSGDTGYSAQWKIKEFGGSKKTEEAQPEAPAEKPSQNK